ncbi:hypothetical protein CHS0354_027572 [Potamilus streckersoni]|uniref:Integrator complex subunit 7 n=1 Tax=Potamilus streckersoni TaxID=2493646 RepID=A0AAE0S132_9BIVA|nr:hypothetical protein CHS0354_027572 [Potamilus streckersoni]
MKTGVQCESIVRFPRLFEKYPFPILINSALLRLADVFRGGNNFIRWCILRVTQQSEKHLDKILSVDEFMKKIVSVYYSNDPIARAVTLRTLGSISSIIAERKNVHHIIVISLDSHDAVEVDAAVFAAGKFSEQSKTFAANICSKISEMINGIATPVELKLQLIPVLRHMHHDIYTAAKARAVCMSLLSSYPAENFCMLTLQTLTHLAAQSLVDIPDQVSLLLDHLVHKDPRRAVKVVALQQLRKLAKIAPHLWKYSFMQILSRFILSTPYAALKIGGLHVLTTLSKSVAFQIFFITEDVDSSLLEVCTLCYQHSDPTLVSKSLELYTHLAIAYSKSKGSLWLNGQNIVEDAMIALQTQTILGASCENTAREQEALKLCLSCVKKLVQTHPDTGESFVSCITNLLEQSQELSSSMFSESLAAIGSQNSKVLQTSALSQVLSLLNKVSQSQENLPRFGTTLCTLVFQAAEGNPVPDHIKDLILTCVQKTDPWRGYQVARQAMRYGQSAIASKIFSSLAQKVSSEHLYFWLMGLHDIGTGESCLQERKYKSFEVLSTIMDASLHYQKGLTLLKAASTPNFPLQFQCEYVNLRVDTMQVHSQLIRTCNTFRTCPPPAIATALAITNGQEITRCGQIVNQLMKCVREYEDLSTRFADLYKTSFDADPESLKNVHQLQMSCELMKLAILSITQDAQDGQTMFADRLMFYSGDASRGRDKFSQQLQTIHKVLDALIQTEGVQKITHKHTEFLSESAESLTRVPNCFPRFFFQSLQSTALKLAVSPQQNSSLDPVLIQYDTHLTLKVEGVVQHGSCPGLFRKVHAVKMEVTSNLQSKNPTGPDTKVTDPTSNSLTQTVEPHNDYFSISFLLAFPVLGIHLVTITASIVDETGTVWNTGPKVNLFVKSYDDAIQRATQSKVSARPSFTPLIS